MSTPNPTHIIPDNVVVLTKRAAFESVAGTDIYHSEDFREGVSLALDALAEVLTDAGYSIVQVPVVGYKAVGESDAQRYLNIACRIEDGYHVGGSNSRGAVAELLRRVAGTLDARTKEGQ